jgi:hypothetical protein
MKLTHHALNEVYSILKQAGAVACPVFKYVKPTKLTPDEYVVINSLPITSGVLQTCRVNVNFYRKNLASGIPNIERLEVGSQEILDFLELTSNRTDGIYIDFESQEIIVSDGTNECYSNLRFKVKLLNK